MRNQCGQGGNKEMSGEGVVSHEYEDLCSAQPPGSTGQRYTMFIVLGTAAAAAPVSRLLL